jgi:hypothetical protein
MEVRIMTAQMFAECIKEMGMRGTALASCIQMMLGM